MMDMLIRVDDVTKVTSLGLKLAILDTDDYTGHHLELIKSQLPIRARVRVKSNR